MYSPFRLAQKYLRYYLTAANGRGHGTHSPFVFEFITKVLNDRQPCPAYDTVEQLRRQLLADSTLLEIKDMGAGSAYTTDTHTRTIADIAKKAAKPPRLGKLLHRFARHYQPSTILELGTSMGLSTAYLATGAPNAAVYTIEGAPQVAAAAEHNLRSLHLTPTVLTGSFDEQLPALLPRIPPVDLAFIDGNHRLEPTLRYFNRLLPHLSPTSALIFDDIHWSAEMEAAWTAIKADSRAMLTIDIFFLGFVIFREEFKVKQDFVIRF
ncbi:MAG TPA: class I SAM-dependent methyltransferase [Puia sp.]|uniref:O-methyltransferase n=1 Tax=Puia sp. TaxID=2045100 RepID=UPI002C24B1E4|nr:class I SAM-dependent methyltransferase [Puia sp.]HVU93917.1 class I SAM-dependent methyltransferase [Puia sp.]